MCLSTVWTNVPVGWTSSTGSRSVEKARAGSVSRTMIRIGELDCNLDRIVTGRPLEAYNSSLVHRHIFGSRCQSLNTSIKVLVSTLVSPLRTCINSVVKHISMYRVFILFFEYRRLVFCSNFVSTVY